MPNFEDDTAIGEILPNPKSNKAVMIAEPESISPTLHPSSIDGYEDSSPYSRHLKQHRVGSTKRMSGRPALQASTSSLHSMTSQSSGTFTSILDPQLENGVGRVSSYNEKQRHHHRRLISQVADWLHKEKARRGARKSKDRSGPAHHGIAKKTVHAQTVDDHLDGDASYPSRRSSELSDESAALDQLERILAEGLNLSQDNVTTPTPAKERKGSYFSRHHSGRRLRKHSTAASSDTENQDGDALVPSAEVILDNTKTLTYTGGAASSEVDVRILNKRATKEKEAWLVFKSEIVRLAHTLRLKGWRRVPLDRGGDIDVERLSGALTNAVYVVSPPKDLSDLLRDKQENTTTPVPKNPPSKLLLRIYGPQVEHLIDRESELQILRRLARKKIGPRLLGTFLNGRFEEFFHARTLTAEDLRQPETSKQIAKRMRELHEGIELLDEERDAGAFVWRNWDKWVGRCEEVITWVDHQILTGKPGSPKFRSGAWKQRGLICGVEWSMFRRTVDRYREWLKQQYGGTAGIREHLVFAHNDTQYGNLLRLEPSGESPLLLPANEHKQLVVIDFEYASANVPGLEFANHFTEWCYNYHNSAKPYALNARNFPTPDEQHRFIKAYVQHRPQLQRHGSATPATLPSPGPSSSISTFMLDSRAPPTQILEEEKQREAATENEIQRLLHETRIWRVANSAQWVAWGIVQAKVPGMGDSAATPIAEMQNTTLASDPLKPETMNEVADAKDKRPEDEEDNEEFDYLGYAQERAMLFWGDVIRYGIVRKEELPEELLGKLKVVEY